MTRVGTYTIVKSDSGYALVALDGRTVGTYPTARAAMEAGVALTAAAYSGGQK